MISLSRDADKQLSSQKICTENAFKDYSPYYSYRFVSIKFANVYILFGNKLFRLMEKVFLSKNH